jgi:putative copper export protein
MPQKMAAAMALLVFATCMVIGGVQADNTFTTTVTRALLAMAGTFVIGLVVGAMGQKMLDENLRAEERKLKNSASESGGEDR